MATIGVCVFCAVTSVAALFILKEVKIWKSKCAWIESIPADCSGNDIKGEIEGCSEIEAALTNGVATALYKKHPAYFKQSISLDILENINEYFKKWAGCANGEEYRKYLCNENQGLYLLIVLALNEIY